MNPDKNNFLFYFDSSPEARLVMTKIYGNNCATAGPKYHGLSNGKPVEYSASKSYGGLFVISATEALQLLSE